MLDRNFINKYTSYTYLFLLPNRLELLHRHSEDMMYKEMEENRLREMKEFEEETKVMRSSANIIEIYYYYARINIIGFSQEEWERALAELARKYEGRTNKKREDDLLRQLTIKREKKLETINTKRRERERMMTAELVDQQVKFSLPVSKNFCLKDIFFRSNEEVV